MPDKDSSLLHPRFRDVVLFHAWAQTMAHSLWGPRGTAYQRQYIIRQNNRHEFILASHLSTNSMMISIVLIATSLMLVTVSGHGNMIHPPVWFDRGGQRNSIGCKVLDLPETEWENENGERATCLDFWYKVLQSHHHPPPSSRYSNQVTTRDGPTLTGDVTQPEVTCKGS